MEVSTYEPTLEVIYLGDLHPETLYLLCKSLSERYAVDNFEFQVNKNAGDYILQIYGDYAIMLDVLSFIDGFLCCLDQLIALADDVDDSTGE